MSVILKKQKRQEVLFFKTNRTLDKLQDNLNKNFNESDMKLKDGVVATENYTVPVCEDSSQQNVLEDENKLMKSSNDSVSSDLRRQLDIKGVSLIHELNRIIEVDNSLGYDVRGCKRSLNRMINGIGDKNATLQDFDQAMDLQRVETASGFPLTPSKFQGDDVTTFCDDVKVADLKNHIEDSAG
ncbi:hypothetical protein Tco_0930745 [Tanacetum coccineum]